MIFTASLKNYADPLLDRLDRFGYCSYRLYREHCVMHDGVYVVMYRRVYLIRGTSVLRGARNFHAALVFPDY